MTTTTHDGGKVEGTERTCETCGTEKCELGGVDLDCGDWTPKPTPPCPVCGDDQCLINKLQAHDIGNELYLSTEVARLRKQVQDILDVLRDDAIASEVSRSYLIPFVCDTTQLKIINQYRAAVLARIKEMK